MPDEPLMSIGNFSRSSLLSVKSLRAYHEQGILIPARVDPQTGYRYYRVSQLIDASVIRRLRGLDLPLRDVAEIVAARDPEVTRKVIAEHELEMQRRLADLTRIVTDLQEVLELPGLQTPVHVRTEQQVHALGIRGRVDNNDYGPFLDRAYGAIWHAALRCGATPADSGSALYPAQVETSDEEVTAYLKIDAPVTLDEAAIDSGVALLIVPEATVAVITHIGGYDSIGDSYAQLGAWVAHNAEPADQPVREHYVVSIDGNGQLLPQNELRTEIAWPILSIKGESS